MDIFGLKMNSRMEDIEDVSLFICLCVSLSHCLDVSLSLLCYNSLYHPQIFASQATFPDHITRSLLLAISVCYLARLQDRKDYEEGVAAEFMALLWLPGGAAQFRNEVQW